MYAHARVPLNGITEPKEPKEPQEPQLASDSLDSSPSLHSFDSASRVREGVPELCPVHKKLFSLHDCDQL